MRSTAPKLRESGQVVSEICLALPDAEVDYQYYKQQIDACSAFHHKKGIQARLFVSATITPRNPNSL